MVANILGHYLRKYLKLVQIWFRDLFHFSSLFHFFLFLFSGPSLENDYGATAMIQQRNMMDYYPNKGKLTNIEHARSPLPMSNSPRPTSFKPLKVNLPTVPTDSPGLKGMYF